MDPKSQQGRPIQNIRTAAEGTDFGSAMILVFHDPTWKLLVGHSTGDLVWKFPCGKIEEQDYPPENPNTHEGDRFSAIARNCALRELKGETGLTEDDLQFVDQLQYVRRWNREACLSHKQKILHQFHFISMAKKGVTLPEHVEEESEMDKREYWGADEILKRAFQPRYSQYKFNPYHAIVLAKTLQRLEEKIGDDRQFFGFHELMKTLRRERLNIQTLPGELDHLTSTHKI